MTPPSLTLSLNSRPYLISFAVHLTPVRQVRLHSRPPLILNTAPLPAVPAPTFAPSSWISGPTHPRARRGGPLLSLSLGSHTRSYVSSGLTPRLSFSGSTPLFSLTLLLTPLEELRGVRAPLADAALTFPFSPLITASSPARQCRISGWPHLLEFAPFFSAGFPLPLALLAAFPRLPSFRLHHPSIDCCFVCSDFALHLPPFEVPHNPPSTRCASSTRLGPLLAHLPQSP